MSTPQEQLSQFRSDLQSLIQDVQNGRLIRPAMQAGGRIVASGIREAAPVGRSATTHKRQKQRALTGGRKGLPKLKASIGTRVRMSGRTDRRGAKSGPSVGMKRKRRAPQGGWIQAGTKRRYRSDGSYAGQITRTNNFSERGTLAVRSRAEAAIIARLEADLHSRLP